MFPNYYGTDAEAIDSQAVIFLEEYSEFSIGLTAS